MIPAVFSPRCELCRCNFLLYRQPRFSASHRNCRPRSSPSARILRCISGERQDRLAPRILSRAECYIRVLPESSSQIRKEKEFKELQEFRIWLGPLSVMSRSGRVWNVFACTGDRMDERYHGTSELLQLLGLLELLLFTYPRLTAAQSARLACTRAKCA